MPDSYFDSFHLFVQDGWDGKTSAISYDDMENLIREQGIARLKAQLGWHIDRAATCTVPFSLNRYVVYAFNEGVPAYDDSAYNWNNAVAEIERFRHHPHFRAFNIKWNADAFDSTFVPTAELLPDGVFWSKETAKHHLSEKYRVECLDFSLECNFSMPMLQKYFNNPMRPGNRSL